MIFIFLFCLINFVNSTYISQFNYLFNKNVNYTVSQLEVDFWHDHPISGYHNSYPPSGINCITSKKMRNIFI